MKKNATSVNGVSALWVGGVHMEWMDASPAGENHVWIWLMCGGAVEFRDLKTISKLNFPLCYR